MTVQVNLGNFEVYLDEKDVSYETYDEPSYRGIIVRVDKNKYDIIYHHKIDWNRMIINRDDGSYLDLPFHEGTFRFLPDCVKVERVK